MNRPSPMVKISQAVDWDRVSILMPRSCDTGTKPGESIGPYAPTTAAFRPMISSMVSFFHCGQFRGSFGESEGCGTSIMLELRPRPCFSWSRGM